jgi:predicted metal-dependent peptidase
VRALTDRRTVLQHLLTKYKQGVERCTRESRNAVATTAPELRNGATAQIPWRLIEELRAELKNADIDWRTFKKEQEG